MQIIIRRYILLRPDKVNQYRSQDLFLWLAHDFAIRMERRKKAGAVRECQLSFWLHDFSV